MVKRQKDRQHNGQKTEEQTTQWSKDRRTDNTMAKRRTDNTMAKRKRKIGQAMIYKTLYRKLEIGQHEHH
jgi:hypothetical protein